ncbi:MAG: PEP-CTERM sorting domain-containing protein [Kiritimatiellae bacterium]|nr:PEP-CTERM sorting domain-containing protein [Kiritimatiellia bacterium]
MKKLIFTLAALLIAHLASAEMLYWMIGDSTNGGSNTIEFNYAVVYAVNGESKIALPNNGEDGEIYGNEELSPITTTNPQMTEFGEGWEYQNYSFYVELFNYDFDLGIGTSVGVSEFATYDSLVSNGHIIPSGMGIPETAKLWMPTTAVPEPTSGLLILIGLASLALKRKNAIR